MIRRLAIGILSTLFFPAMLSCEKLPDPVQPDQPKQETDTTMPETIKITVSGK
jgi:hypothetical protein